VGVYKRKIKKGIRFFYSGQYLNQKYHSKAIYLTKGECAKAERGRIKELDEKARNQSEDMPIKEMFEERLNFLELEKNRFYYEDNRRHAKFAIKAWGNIKAGEVSRAIVNRLLMDELRRCREAGLSNHRVNALLTNLKSFFNFGINRLGLDIKNPCLGIEKFRIDRALKFVPTDEMIQAVLDICDDDQKALVNFLKETGARVGEALKFKVQDILDENIILYTRKARYSSLTPRIINKPSLPPLPKSGKVFKWNRRPDFLGIKVKKLKQPEWSYHSLRHKFAQDLACKGESTISIMQRLGHNSISTTMIYLRSLGAVRE
jgi:integrase/recombinase XerD